MIFLSLNTFAFDQKDKMDGWLRIDLDSEEYLLNEEVELTITYKNTDDAIINDAYLYLFLVEPGKMVVRHDLGIVNQNINLSPNEEKILTAKFTIPDYLEASTYELWGYFKQKRASIQGKPEIMLPGIMKKIKIISDKDALPYIESETSEVLDGVEQVGKLADKPTITGSFKIINNDYKGNLSYNIEVYEWEFTSGDLVAEYEYNVKDVSKRQEFEFETPKKPTAYSVKIILIDENENEISQVVSRFVVPGLSGKIDLLNVDSRELKEDEDTEVFYKVLAPAEFDVTQENKYQGTLRVTLEPKDKTATVLLKEIPITFEDLYEQYVIGSFVIKSKINSELFDVKAELITDNKTLDSYEFTVDKDNFNPAFNSIDLKIYTDNKFEEESDYARQILNAIPVIKNSFKESTTCESLTLLAQRIADENNLTNVLLYRGPAEDGKEIKVDLTDKIRAGNYNISVFCQDKSARKTICFGSLEVCEKGEKLNFVTLTEEEVKEDKNVLTPTFIPTLQTETEEEPIPWHYIAFAIVLIIIIGAGYFYLQNKEEEEDEF